ncbi:SDR family oxidoreductase [Sphingopyxis alaskensis]|jgi:uncharacterized protein YbjT (DUF2867 family)|uniref:SDR family oxidoreductase n=1 Tax=Sphingopyxis alaskensis TaxID=117207 RepID=UPI0020420C92|nr:NmrA family NAD(P)-binding protein [Sphingopyxis alaskensis]MCM3420244.1 NmrA family NAD(P)-binding protein [Sphingopyxis alaskensis]
MAEAKKIFLNCAGSRTQQAIARALTPAGHVLHGYGRDLADTPGLDHSTSGSLLDGDALAVAMAGADVAIHVAPALQDKEVAMGQFAIDAARRAGVGHFVYISVIHPQIDYLMNHRAKLAVEDYLIGSGLAYTILRPMHYFQNLDVRGAREHGRIDLTYAIDRPLGFVDMEDVAAVAAKVVNGGTHHHYACYDLCSADHLTGVEIAETLTVLVGRPIAAHRIPLPDIIAILTPYLAFDPARPEWTAGAIERLFSYYDRFGLRGSPNQLAWLLGRAPADLADFARREIDIDD